MDVQDSGSLDQKAFLTLLVELHQGNATGSLKLERAPLQKAVYFRDGQILFAASNDPQDQLASILVDEGKLSKDQMQVAQARVSAGNPLAKVLTELGYISQRELADAARLKVEKILTDLYQWNDGSYQFVERSLPKGAIDLELSTPRLLFNSIRRVQEREWVLEQLGSLDTVLSATPSLERFLSDTKPDPSAGEVLRLVDGVKSIKQIGAVSALGEFEVCKIVTAALRVGAVEKLETAGVAAPKPRAASPSARGPAGARLPFSEGSVAETTALHIGEGIASPPHAQEEDDELPLRPVPLSEAEKRAPRPSRPAADFVFDEPPVAASSEERRVPRPRKMRRGGGGGGGKKFLVAALALVLLGGGAGAAYYFLWPRGPSAGSTVSPSTPTNRPPITDRSPTTDAEAPDSEGTGNAGTGAATGTPPSTTAPPTTATAPTGPTPTSPSDPPLPTAGQQRPVTAGTAPPPTATSPSPRPTPPPSPPPTTPPTRPTTRPSPSSQPLAQGQQQLRTGDYAQAAAIFLSHLRGVGADKFTIAVGVFCDTGNLERVVNSSGGREELLVLAFDNGGRSCYRVFWGIFDSREEAQRALGSVPAGVRARDSAPVPIERLIP